MNLAGMQTFLDDAGAHRVKDTEYVYPVVVGTVAFPLGKKATDAASHRWTCYLRGVNNEDLSHIISRVQFDLHPTFNNPQRLIEQQPFEVTEHGWGEFEIVVHIQFTVDAGESEAIMYHRLKLYEDGEQYGGRQDPKKVVVTETFEELVFSEPRLEFYNRMRTHVPSPAVPPNPLAQYFKPPVEAEELEALRAMRAKVQQCLADIRKELGQAGLAQFLPQGMTMPAATPAPALPAGTPHGQQPGQAPLNPQQQQNQQQQASGLPGTPGVAGLQGLPGMLQMPPGAAPPPPGGIPGAGTPGAGLPGMPPGFNMQAFQQAQQMAAAGMQMPPHMPGLDPSVLQAMQAAQGQGGLGLGQGGFNMMNLPGMG